MGVSSALVSVHINDIEGILIKTLGLDTIKEHYYNMYIIKQEKPYMISKCACVPDIHVIRRWNSPKYVKYTFFRDIYLIKQ